MSEITGQWIVSVIPAGRPYDRVCVVVKMQISANLRNFIPQQFETRIGESLLANVFLGCRISYAPQLLHRFFQIP
jgi:hypothetical protein